MLVTGSTGRVGRHVAAGLVAAGVGVRAARTQPGRDAPSELAGSEQVRFDVRDRSSWSGALSGVDRVFLMRPPDVTDVSATMTPFLRALREHGVKQVVFLSVKGVNPAMPHWRVERSMRRLRLAGTWLRAADFMQNLEGPYREQVRTSRLLLPAGRGRTSFVDTRDVAAVAVRCLVPPAAGGGGGRGIRTVTCTGPQALSWFEVADILSEVLGRRVRYEPVGLRDFRRRLRRAGTAPAMVNVQSAIHLAAQAGLAAGVSEDMPLALGRPATSFRQYAADAREVWASGPMSCVRGPRS